MAKEWTPEERAAMSAKMKAKHAAAKAPAEEIVAAEVAAPDDDAPAMAMGESDEWRAEPLEAVEPIPEAPLTPFDHYIAAIPEEERDLLDIEDLRKEFEAAEREALTEKRRQARERAKERAKEHARAAAGLTTQVERDNKALREKMSRMVKVTVSLPFLGENGGVSANGVTIDGTRYVHGQTYTVPYGRALVLRDILYRMHQVELDFEGKGRMHGLRQQRVGTMNLATFGNVNGAAL